MQNIPSKVGIEWIRQGFALFRKQPAELSMLFLLYMLLMCAVSLIPLIGQALPLLLVPVFSMAFLQACVHIEQGKTSCKSKKNDLYFSLSSFVGLSEYPNET